MGHTPDITHPSILQPTSPKRDLYLHSFRTSERTPTDGIIRRGCSLSRLSVFGSCPGYHPRNAASSGHLPRGAIRAPTSWKPLDIFSGARGFVLRGVRSVSAGEVDLVGRFVVAQPFVAWMSECATDEFTVLDVTHVNWG